jgi:L-threonylcarbamoyladenylate synthase
MVMVETLVLKVDPSAPDIRKIRLAAEVLRGGGLVAFPTETVYGLGANALDERAVLKIFEVKQRPADNPLIVHIAEIEDIYVLVGYLPPKAEDLMRRFWPGPLTLLLPRSELVPDVTTAGLSTVAVRMPSHPIARMLIKEADVPVAAPSANLSGRPSPTTASHVLEDLAGKIEVVIDGGEVEFGLESTILDLTSAPPTLLRPGPITVEELREILGEIKIHPVAKAEEPIEKVIALSPGMKYRHYAPRAKVIVVEGSIDAVVGKIQELAMEYMRRGKKVGIMATAENAHNYGLHVKVVGERQRPKTIARNLFKILREFDEEGVDIVIAEGIEPVGVGLAIMNRLRKAAGHEIVRV